MVTLTLLATTLLSALVLAQDAAIAAPPPDQAPQAGPFDAAAIASPNTVPSANIMPASDAPSPNVRAVQDARGAQTPPWAHDPHDWDHGYGYDRGWDRGYHGRDWDRGYHGHYRR